LEDTAAQVLPASLARHPIHVGTRPLRGVNVDERIVVTPREGNAEQTALDGYRKPPINQNDSVKAHAVVGGELGNRRNGFEVVLDRVEV